MCMRRVGGRAVASQNVGECQHPVDVTRMVQALRTTFRSLIHKLPNIFFDNVVEVLAKEGKSLDRTHFDQLWSSSKLSQRCFPIADDTLQKDVEKECSDIVSRALLHGGKSIDSAFEEGTRIAKLLTSKDVPPPTQLHLIKSFCDKELLNKYGFNVITSIPSVVINRERSPTMKVNIIPTPELDSLVALLKLKKNVVVQGCSGIGKTVAMLCAGGSKLLACETIAEHICFYVTESRLKAHFCEATRLLNLSIEELLKEDKCSHSSEDARAAFRARRNDMIATSIALALTSATKTSDTLIFQVLSNLDVEVVLTVCVDEAGSHAFAVPSMTQITDEQMKAGFKLLAAKAKLGFTFDVSHNVTFRFVVGGTGIGSANRPDGSLPGFFGRVVLSPVPNDALLKEALNGALKDKNRAGKVHAMIQDDPVLHTATRNSRLAVLLAAEVQKSATLVAWFGANDWDKSFRSGQLVVKGGVPRIVLLHCFYAAALEFKGTNGLSTLTGCSAVASVLSQALRAHFFPASHDFDEATVRLLVCTYGVLVDRSAWYHEATMINAVRDEIVWLTGTGDVQAGMRLGAPKTGRYDFADSEKAILQLLMWGERPLASTSTGRELELATQSAMALLVMACRRQTEFQHLICSPKPTFKQFDDSLVFYGANSVLVLTQLCKNSYNVADAQRLAGSGVVSATCVALSTPLFPFADVTVLFGDHVYLVQCKDTKEELHTLFQGAELFKMGFAHEKPAFVTTRCTAEQILEVADQLKPTARNQLKACVAKKHKRLAKLHKFLKANATVVDLLYAKIGSRHGNLAGLVSKHTKVVFPQTIKKRIGVLAYSGRVVRKPSPHQKDVLQFNLNDLAPLLPRQIPVDGTVLARTI